MGKRTKKSISESELGSNPLVGGEFKISVIKRTDAEKWVQGEDGLKNAEFTMEREPICKVYTKPEHRKLVSGLSSAAQALFYWFIYELEPGKDWVWLNKPMFMKEAKIGSNNTFNKGRAELIKEKIINQSCIKGVYWINPRLLFNGSRVEKYPDHVVEYNPNKMPDNDIEKET